MKKLFKNRNFFLLFQGSLVSAIGTSLYGFAAGLYIVDLFGEDGGAIYLAMFMAVSIVTMVVLSPIAGLLADRINKIRILYITDFIRGFLFFATLYILSLGLDKEVIIWILLGITFLASVNQAFFGPAATAAIPEVVGEDMIQAANGANNVIHSMQTILGVIVGMFLYELVGFEIAIWINAISFMFSAVSEMFIKVKHQKQESENRTLKDHLEDIKFGFKYLVKKEGLLTMMLFSLMLNFCFAPLFSVGVPYLFREEFVRSAYELGGVDIAFSVTALVASFIIGGMKLKSLRSSIAKGVISIAGAFVFATLTIVFVTYGVIGYWFFYVLFLIAMVLIAFTTTSTNIPLNTGMMKAIEPSVRGRVFATIHALSMGAIPIGTMLAGFLVDATNVAMLGIVCSVIVIMITIVFVPNKKVKALFDGIDKNTRELEEKKKLEEQQLNALETA